MFFQRLMGPGVFSRGHQGQETLDRPLSNFDVIGIPTDRWSSHFCACYENIVPSCLMALFCPCILWAQVIVRAQIPQFIGIKNSLGFTKVSGFRLFIDFYMWSLILCLLFLSLVIFIPNQSTSLRYGLILLLVIAVALRIFLIGHSVTAFREK
jgi:hypothetical protein